MKLFSRQAFSHKSFQTSFCLRTLAATGLCSLACVASLPVKAAPQYSSQYTAQYTIKDLGALNASASAAVCLNDQAQTAGEANTGNGPLQVTHAYLWHQGTRVDLGTLGGKYSAASGINARTEIAGTAQREDNNQHAFIGEPAPADPRLADAEVTEIELTDLGTLGGDTSAAYGINNIGQVVGTAYVKPGNAAHHAFFWQPLTVNSANAHTELVGRMEDLGTLGGGSSVALAISDLGNIVGMADLANGNYHACLWSLNLKRIVKPASQPADLAGKAKLELGWLSRQKHDLGTLGGRYSVARAINTHSVIVGQAMTASGEKHAFLYQNDKMLDLHPLSSSFSDALGINVQDQVVGFAELTTGEYHAYLYSHGQTQDLNTLVAPNSGWLLEEAHAINATGQIAGFGHINGQKHAFLLTPTLR